MNHTPFARSLPRSPIPTGARNNGVDAKVKPGAGECHGGPGNPRKSSDPRSDDWDVDWPYFQGFGSASGLGPDDPRNPRLAGLRSVSYAAACALRRPEPPRPPIGFHTPRAK